MRVPVTLKRRPGSPAAKRSSQGTSGVGGPSPIAGLLFQRATGTRFQLIPYRGAAPAMQDVAAGHVDMMFDVAATSLAPIRASTIKAYAVTAGTRLAMAPEIPTANEVGLPELQASVWLALFAPKRTPRAIIDRLNDAVRNALSNSAVRQQPTDLGFEIPLTDRQTPEALEAYLKAEIDKWWPIVKAANIKPQ